MTGALRVELTEHAGEFWRRAEHFLTADPVVNSVPLTLAALRRDGAVTDPEPATYAMVTDDTDIVGAALRTPPRSVLLTRMPTDALAVLAERFAAARPDAPGVNGPVEEAERFAELWGAATGGSYRVEMRQRLHQLDALTAPTGVPGSCRAATAADTELLVDWTTAFGEEADPNADARGHRADVELRLAQQRAYLWQRDGVPVSYVGHQRTVAGTARVGPVYTPVEHRGHGYASALVAEVSRRLAATAETVCLFTDLANPTANRIYAAVGYRPVCDTAAFAFTR